jgi:NitT/TauT family transport system ATP-binding protein
MLEIPLPRPRNQLTTRENSEFLRLRRELFTAMQEMLA